MRRGAPVESTWHRVGNWKIHMRYAADGRHGRPAVVLVHGLGVSSRYMVPTLRLLGRDFDVYAPDLPGFGRSTKPRHVLSVRELADALAAWIDASGLDAPVLLGNSFGCQIIVDMAARYRRKAARLVLVGPTVDPRRRTALLQIADWAADVPREQLSLAAVVGLDYLRCGPRRLFRTLRHALDDAIEAKLPHVGVPALVVRGLRDTVVPQRWAEEVAALLPAGRLALIPGAAHALHFTAPLELSRVTRAFLNGPC